MMIRMKPLLINYSSMRGLHLLSRLVELYLCLCGELLVRHLQVASLVAHYETEIEKVRSRFRESYHMELDS